MFVWLAETDREERARVWMRLVSEEKARVSAARGLLSRTSDGSRALTQPRPRPACLPAYVAFAFTVMHCTPLSVVG